VPSKVKFDLTLDEVLTQSPTLRPTGHHHSDQPLPVRGLLSDHELFGEKLRALADRCRPRDDVSADTWASVVPVRIGYDRPLLTWTSRRASACGRGPLTS
jgi:hypothetical protein